MTDLQEKKILVIIPSFYPFVFSAGPSIYLHKLFNFIASNNANIKFKVLTTNFGNEREAYSYSNFEKNYQKNYKVFYSKINFKQLSFKMFSKILKEINNNDIVYFNSFFSIYLIFLNLINFKKKKIYISPRGQLIHNSVKKKNYILKLIFILLTNFLKKNITLVFSCQHEKIESSKYTNKFHSIIIPNSSVFDKIEFKQPNFKKLTNKDKINILTITRLSKRKNVDLIIESANITKSKNYIFTIAGPDYGEKKHLESEINKNNLKNVNLLGFVNESQKDELFANTDIFLLPSENENFGNIFLESIYYYKPIIFLKDSPWNEINSINKVGISINKSVKEINNAINTIINSYEDFDYENFQKVQKNFSKENVSKIFLSYFQ